MKTSGKACNYLYVFIIISIFFSLSAGCRSRSSGAGSACQSNMKNIATALEMYAVDFSGDYPPSLDYLTISSGNYGPYMRTMPKCPKTNYEYEYTFNSQPDNFTLYCKGWAHREVWPAQNIYYTPDKGITFQRDPVPTQKEQIRWFIKNYMPIAILITIIIAAGITIMIITNLLEDREKQRG